MAKLLLYVQVQVNVNQSDRAACASVCPPFSGYLRVPLRARARASAAARGPAAASTANPLLAAEGASVTILVQEFKGFRADAKA